MKLKTKPGTKTSIHRNLELAQKLLGELRYYRFIPHERYGIKKGFVCLSVNPPALYPFVVLIKSRGSFLEVRADAIFSDLIVKRLRSVLWVPIHKGADITETKPEQFSHHVSQTETDQLQVIFPNIRLQ